MCKNNRVKLGISACLLGFEVRYDGGHKRITGLEQILGAFFELIPVCPEVDAGLGVPRPPLHLVWREGQVKAIGVENKALDATQVLEDYSHQFAQDLGGICGFVFKSRSPSCGYGTTPILHETTGLTETGNGLFVQGVTDAQPRLPIIDEVTLGQVEQRQDFFRRVEMYRSWRQDGG